MNRTELAQLAFDMSYAEATRDYPEYDHDDYERCHALAVAAITVAYPDLDAEAIYEEAGRIGESVAYAARVIRNRTFLLVIKVDDVIRLKRRVTASWLDNAEAIGLDTLRKIHNAPINRLPATAVVKVSGYNGSRPWMGTVDQYYR